MLTPLRRDSWPMVKPPSVRFATIRKILDPGATTGCIVTLETFQSQVDARQMFASGAKDGSDVTDATTDGEAPPLNLETFLPYRLAVLSSVVSQALSQVYANHGLTMSEWFVLMTLGERSPATGKAVSATLRMHKTKVSRIVSSLLERKLISRRFNQADLRQ